LLKLEPSGGFSPARALYKQKSQSPRDASLELLTFGIFL
jgi:hypothetical protein